MSIADCRRAVYIFSPVFSYLTFSSKSIFLMTYFPNFFPDWEVFEDTNGCSLFKSGKHIGARPNGIRLPGIQKVRWSEQSPSFKERFLLRRITAQHQETTSFKQNTICIRYWRLRWILVALGDLYCSIFRSKLVGITRIRSKGCWISLQSSLCCLSFSLRSLSRRR